MTDRRAFYDQRAPLRAHELDRHYHELLKRHYAFLIPTGARVMELGCGLGDLLAAVKPKRGVGVDFSPAMIERARARHPDLHFELAQATELSSGETFDYLILSDFVNDQPDVHALFERLHTFAHPRTRLVVNFFSNLWRPILALAQSLGEKSPTPPQNWISTRDMKNLLYLAGWEVVKTDPQILWPARTPVVGPLLNRWVGPVLHHLCLTVFLVARPSPGRRMAMRPPIQAGQPSVTAGAAPGRNDVSVDMTGRHYRCSVVIPARNEAGNIEAAVQRTPEMGLGTEILFIEGHSQDNTWEEIQRVAARHPERNIKVLKQQSAGKGGAVREAFAVASGDVLMILDADLTVMPEQLPKFYDVLRAGTADFVNGVRLVYPMEQEAMRFLNMIANKFFSLAFSWLLGQPIKDTLCGTKVLFRADYEAIARNRSFFGDFDPFGDFDLLFGAAKLNLRIVDLPIRYQARTYGETNIHRWRHGWLLLRMVWFAARRLKFVG